MSEKLLLIDGFNLLSRCYFATSYGREEADLPRNSKGLFTNALRVVVQKMNNLIKQYEPTHIVVAWDVKRNETKRKQAYSFYKETRNDLPVSLIQQYETLRTFFQTVGIPQLSVELYEADDVIGAFSLKWTKQKQSPAYIYSNDRDLFQLLNEHVSQIVAKPKIGDVLYTATDFKSEYGISPTQWVDVKALLGDKSDNIPGVPGVGEKAALPLIQQYGSIEGIYAKVDDLDVTFNRYKKKLKSGQELAELSLELVKIDTDIEAVNLTEWPQLKFERNLSLWEVEINRLELNIMLQT
ncbi:5'-3' exonuclease [Priestia flexa]|uniref:5'-3' exonuclease n=1 Tax=Priestia flexa TaxID=86664 RepID=UPI000C246F49|nr:5'-3' exonuclease [Priestia flexa]MEC0668482.1 5'-3' exonuclease [Priestia flexa]MED3825730.1 5'-3' exonuclease [Priestia flexa]